MQLDHAHMFSDTDGDTLKRDMEKKIVNLAVEHAPDSCSRQEASGDAEKLNQSIAWATGAAGGK